MSRIKPTPEPTSTSGYYEKTNWQTGDVITRPKMMNIEDWLASATDELFEARTGYTTNHQSDWIKYQYSTIGERIDDIVDYVRKVVTYTNIDELIRTIDEYLDQIIEYVDGSADEAVQTIEEYESSVQAAAEEVLEATAGLSDAVAAAYAQIDQSVDDVETYANNTAGKGKKQIDTLVAEVTNSKNTAITSITNDKNAVSGARTSAENSITKYVDNETPAAGENEGVKQIAEQAIEEINALVEEVQQSIADGGVVSLYSNFSIAVSNWTGSGPYTYVKTFSGIEEEFCPEINMDEQSFTNLTSSINVASNAQGAITFTVSKKPIGAINIRLILKKVKVV